MVALKAGEIDGFIAKPATSVSLVLIYGPDAGLVSERASALVSHVAGENNDPFSLIKLDAADVAADPTRLMDEALTIPLFGGRRVIWVKDGGSKNIVAAIDPLLKETGEIAFVVIEAGDLKKGVALRKRFESDRRALAIPCYADAARDVDRLIDEETRAARLSISREARQSLHGLLGANRLASRGELQKLCLYAHGKERIESADVELIIGDASAFAADELVDAVALGDIGVVDHGLERLEAGGLPADVIANQALRHFQFLYRARGLMDKGTPAAQTVERASPPIFFKRREKVTRQLGLWRFEDLEKAMEHLASAVLASRKTPMLANARISDVFLILARVARARAQPRSPARSYR